VAITASSQGQTAAERNRPGEASSKAQSPEVDLFGKSVTENLDAKEKS